MLLISFGMDHRIRKFNDKQVRKVLVAELEPPHAQSAWGFRGERVRGARLAACYNYH